MIRNIATLAAVTLFAGCFYPPQAPPPAPNRTRATLDLPYDLALDAVRQVISRENFHVVTDNPNSGIIEAQKVGGFTLEDADCGKLRGVAGRYEAQPYPDSSVVYDFHTEAESGRVTNVSVQGTFTTPLHVPMHPVSTTQCVSRGHQEARLIREIKEQAAREHRDEAPLPARETVK